MPYHDGERSAAKARRVGMNAGNLSAALAIPEIAALREALEFYANGTACPYNHDAEEDYELIDYPDGSSRHAPHKFGTRARRALAALEKDANGG